MQKLLFPYFVPWRAWVQQRAATHKIFRDDVGIVPYLASP